MTGSMPGSAKPYHALPVPRRGEVMTSAKVLRAMLGSWNLLLTSGLYSALLTRLALPFMAEVPRKRDRVMSR